MSALPRRGQTEAFGSRTATQLSRISKTSTPPCFLVDPLNHAHSLDDGNSNVAIAKVALEITRVATDAGVAALILHHLRKGSNGEADDLMGATSLRATFRSCRILARMDKKEAESFGVAINEVWRYSRISGSKENYAPPPELSTWYKLESVQLGNGAGLYLDGDSLQVTQPHGTRPRPSPTCPRLPSPQSSRKSAKAVETASFTPQIADQSGGPVI